MCNFLEYKGTSPHLSRDKVLLTVWVDTKIVYRRYASLFFIAGCDSADNELINLEIVHRFVEQMDKYYGNVCELDIIFNFQKAYFILDELLLAGEMQESSKKNVLRCISQQDGLEDMEVRFARCSFFLLLFFHKDVYDFSESFWGIMC
jgi:AP-1 complex subunit sigma 1/2